MTKLTHAQLDELMRLGHGKQLANTPRSRVQNTLGKMGFAKFVEGVVTDFWEITEEGQGALKFHEAGVTLVLHEKKR